tara:strand:- start:3 stop:803 length:801 start_codon:yes stop_codon:yes gene_type:complete
MGFNIFKRKKEEPIYLDCYTYSHYAYNHAKIEHSRKYFPEWFKDTDSYFVDGEKNKIATIKHCRAFMDYYSTGIVIPLWGEVEITVHPLGDERVFTWRSSNPDFDLHCGNHGTNQWGTFSSKKLQNIKFASPWLFKTVEPVNFTWSQPTWSQPETFNGFIGLPAVMQFKSQMFTAVNYVVELTAEEQAFNLQPLTPLAILHPMTERKVMIRTHLVTQEKWDRMTSRAGGMLLDAEHPHIGDKSNRTHAKKEKFWDKADELNKCPFK